MRSLSTVLRAAKNDLDGEQPWLLLLELEKSGWFRVWYEHLASAFHEESTAHDTNGTDARILFNVPTPGDSRGDGYLVVSEATSPYQFYAGHLLSDDHSGLARPVSTVDVDEDDDPITFYFVRNLEEITYGGNVYDPLPFSLDPVRIGGDNLPTAELSLSNVERMAESWIRKGDGFLGETATLKIIWAGDLTEDPAWEASFKVMKAAANKEAVTLTLGMESPYLRSFPRYRYSRKVCRWRFEDDGCGYTGATYSSCGKTLGECIERMDDASISEIRFGGAPGIPGGFFDVG